VKRLQRAGRHRAPQVFADFDADDEVGQVRAAEQDVGPKRHIAAEQTDRSAIGGRGRRKEPGVVVFLVRRQVRLGDDAEHISAMDDRGAVVDLVIDNEREPDDGQAAVEPG
jgi:hypothetical protein